MARYQRRPRFGRETARPKERPVRQCRHEWAPVVDHVFTHQAVYECVHCGVREAG